MVKLQIFFIFTPKIGEDEPFRRAYFSNGWFNHKLVVDFNTDLGVPKRGGRLHVGSCMISSDYNDYIIYQYAFMNDLAI